MSPPPASCYLRSMEMQPFSGRTDRLLLIAAVLAGLAACTYHGPAQEDPLQRRFTWYSYLNGDDLRARCAPGAAPAYRFVYNGVYVQQLRTYDITPAARGSGADMRVQVIGPAQLNDVSVRLQASTLYDDLTAPWRGTIETVPLTGDDLGQLDRALAASGFLQPAPDGLRLRGEDFFWIVGACVGGSFHFNAYKWESPAFAAITFPQLLLSWDPTGLPLNPPRSLSPFEIYGQTAPEAGTGPTYSLTVGRNGLVAVKPLF